MIDENKGEVSGSTGNNNSIPDDLSDPIVMEETVPYLPPNPKIEMVKRELKPKFLNYQDLKFKKIPYRELVLNAPYLMLWTRTDRKGRIEPIKIIGFSSYDGSLGIKREGKEVDWYKFRQIDRNTELYTAYVPEETKVEVIPVNSEVLTEEQLTERAHLNNVMGTNGTSGYEQPSAEMVKHEVTDAG